MLQVCIIEDDDRIRDTLQLFLESYPDMQVICACPSADVFLRNSGLQAIPDVILLDINLPGTSGVDAIPGILDRYPDVKIIMNSVNTDDDSIFRSLKNGAYGYLTKDTPLPKMYEALKDTTQGSPLTPAIAHRIVQYFARQKKITDQLSPREREIVESIMDGLSYKMIADKYFISIDTVRTHIARIYRKLNINSKGELMAAFGGFS